MNTTAGRRSKAFLARFVGQTDNDVAPYDWSGQGLLKRCDLPQQDTIKSVN